MKEEIQNCLEYCEQANGLPYCKNCGLTQEMIDSFKKVVREETRNELREIIETKLKNDPNNPVLVAGLEYVLVVLSNLK